MKGTSADTNGTVKKDKSGCSAGHLTSAAVTPNTESLPQDRVEQLWMDVIICLGVALSRVTKSIRRPIANA